MRFFKHHLLRHMHHHHNFRHDMDDDHFGRGGHRHHRHGDHFDELLSRASAMLELNAQQREHLNELLTQLQRQRRSLHGALSGPELQALVASENFDRAGAQAQFDARIEQLRGFGPALTANLGDFFDSLDFEQQQALRFMLRARRGS